MSDSDAQIGRPCSVSTRESSADSSRAALQLLGRHRLVQAAPRLVHPPRDRALADLLDDRDLAVRQALQRDEDHGRAHVDRQRVERAEQARVGLAQLGLAAGVAARVDRDGELEARIVERRPRRGARDRGATLSERLTVIR